MASVLTFDTGRHAYPRVLQFVVDHGQPRTARGLPTLDCAHVTVELLTPLDALPLGTGRAVRSAIGALEAVQLIGAFSDPELCVRIAPNFQRYREPSGVFHGAYGRRISNQFAAALTKIRHDPETRQAIINLWDPFLDNRPGMRDYPCTIALRLSLNRVGDVELDVLMRSNDAWLGTPYDWFQFTQLQITAARILGRGLGAYRHTAWSLHLYRSDLDAVGAVLDTNVHPFRRSTLIPDGIGVPGETVQQVQSRARLLTQPVDPVDLDLRPDTDSERWYRDRLAPPDVLQPDGRPAPAAPVLGGQRPALPELPGDPAPTG